MSLVTLKRKTEESYKRANANANANANPSRGRNEGAMGTIVFDADTPRMQQSVSNNIIHKFHSGPRYNHVHRNGFTDQSTLLEKRKTDITYVKVNSTIVQQSEAQAGNARPQCSTTKDVSVPSQSDRLSRLRQFQGNTKST
jgi:hypothetical protein